MKALTKILFIAVLIMFSNGDLFGQIGFGNSQKPVKTPENFEHIGCGFRWSVTVIAGYSASNPFFGTAETR